MPDISILFLPTPSGLDPEPALRSVLASELQSWELWVPESIAAASWLQDPRVRAWPWPVSEAEFSLQGLMAQCVERAAGRYLAWIEPRHRWTPTKLGAQYAAIEAEPDVAIVASGVAGSILPIQESDLAVQLAVSDVLDGWSNALVRREVCVAALEHLKGEDALSIAPELLPFVATDWFGAVAVAQSAIALKIDVAISTNAIALVASDIEPISPLQAPRIWDTWQTRTALAERIEARQFARIEGIGATVYGDWRIKARSNRLKLQVAEALDWLYDLAGNGESKVPKTDAISTIENLLDNIHAALRQLRQDPEFPTLSALHDTTIRAIALHHPAVASLDPSLRPANPAEQWRAALCPNPTPTASVGIPVYNGAATIAATIDSILAQTHTDFELIVIDDGSTDNTGEIVATFDDPRLRLLRFENAGLAASRNRAMQVARAEYISFIDADDLWTPDKLADQLQALRDSPRAAVAYSFTDYIDDAGEHLRSGSHITVDGDALPHLLLTDFLENGSNVMVRRSACERVGGFDENLPAAEDWDFLLKLAARYPFVCVPKPQILYRLTDSAMSFDVKRQERAWLDVLERAFDSVPTPFSSEERRVGNGCRSRWSPSP